MTPKRKGIISEQKVIAKLLELGYDISVPIGDNSRYDIILDHKGKLFRCQIKTAALNKDVLHIQASSARTNKSKNYRTSYYGQVDFLIAYCPDTNDYLYYHLDKDSCRVQLTVRLNPSKNNQKEGVNLLQEHLLDNMSAYIEKYRVEPLKFGESDGMLTPSQAEQSEGVET